MRFDQSESASRRYRPEILRALKRPQDDTEGGPPDRPAAGPTGFSLLELLVVLTLLGLMAAVVAPALASLDAPVATTPADEVVRLFLDARRTAVTEARTVDLRIDLQHGKYRVDDATGPSTTGVLRAGGSLRVRDGAEVGGWRFTPDGRVMGPALYVMSGTLRTIRFDPGTGELLP